MPAKTKEEEKVAVLKGQEAEDCILQYLKKMNRPFGAVDVCANLKGAVPKAHTQKILVALAEKGEITQKAYGKTTFFVAKQDSLEDVPPEKLASLEAELKAIDEEVKGLAAEVKAASSELTKLKNTPSDDVLDAQIEETQKGVIEAESYLLPLRAGTPMISATELARIDADWVKWRAEWVARRKVYKTLWDLVADSLPPKDAEELAEDLGIEQDTEEYLDLEKSPLCSTVKRR